MDSHFRIRGEIENFISGKISQCTFFSFVTSENEAFETNDDSKIHSEWLLKTKEAKILAEFKKVLIEKFGNYKSYRDAEVKIGPGHRFLLLIIEK